MSHTRSDGPPLRVMVVDDEATNRRLAARMLQRLSRDVVVTVLEDGDEIEGALIAAGYTCAAPQRRHSRSRDNLGLTDGSSNAGGNAGHGDGTATAGSGDVGLTGGTSAPADAAPSRILPTPYDAILLDIMMRRTNGVDVLVDLTKKFKNSGLPLPPVVAMTGNTSLTDMMTYKAAGFVHLLGKPFDNDALVAALKACSTATAAAAAAAATAAAAVHAKARAGGPVKAKLSVSMSLDAAPAEGPRSTTSHAGSSGGSGGGGGAVVPITSTAQARAGTAALVAQWDTTGT